MSTQTFIATLTLVDCPSCGVHFVITQEFEARRREDHRAFYCPNHHRMIYRESVKERELNEAKANADRQSNRAQLWKEAAATAQRSAAASRGVVTKLKKRVGKGCPCCKGQHQGWSEEQR